MTAIKCEACGSGELKRFGNTYECIYCGSKYMVDDNDTMLSKELTDIEVISLLELAEQYHKNRNYASELRVLNAAFVTDENNAEVCSRLGRCFKFLDRMDKSIEYYQRSIDLRPLDGSGYANLGTAYLLMKNYEQAASVYEKGIPLIKKDTSGYWIATANYAIAVARLGDPIRAEKMIREAEAHGYKNAKGAREMAGIKDSLGFRMKVRLSGK